MRKEFIYSKVAKNKNGTQSEDIQMGDIQKTCTGLNIMSVLILVVFFILLYMFGGYFLDEFHINSFNPSFLSMEIEFLISDILDNLGKFLILFGMTLVSIAGMVYGLYCSFFKKITFYKYGMVVGKKRIIYADIKKLECKRVKGVSLTASFVRMYAYNQFNIILEDENSCVSINSSEYNGMNDVMTELCHQFSDIYINKN